MANGLEIMEKGIDRSGETAPHSSFRKNFKVFYQKYGYLLAAFTLPLIIMWLIYIVMGVYPFGSSSVLVLDLNGQYVYFFEELREKLVSGGSLLYTWSRSLGGEFMGIFAYYLASPFSFITLLFPKDHMTEALLCMILLKTGSMGLTMGIYLHNTRRSGKIGVITFSTIYALTAYAVVQAHNTMWIDNLILLPLLTLGIEQLITKRRFALFTVSLSLCMLTNFYIGYMVCIYTVVYFIYYYFAHNSHDENNFYMERGHFWRSLLRITVYSLTAAAIAAVIILPTYYSLSFGKSTFSQTSYEVYEKFSFLDMFYKLFPGSYDTVRPEGLPFLYSGLLTLLLLPVYFFSSEIRAREKMCTAALIGFFFFSFNCSVIDIVWHGMQKPNWLNYRYSFMLCFVLIVAAYKGFCLIKTANYRVIILTAVMLSFGLLFAQIRGYDYIKDIDCVWISIICMAVLCFVLHAVRYGYIGEGAKFILAVAVCLELFLSGLVNTISLDEDVVISSRDSYNGYLEKIEPLVNYIKAHDTSAFYRMEKTTHRKTNDSMALDFNGISGSTSTLNASVVSLLADFGYTSKSHWSKYVGGNIVSDSLLGIKYVISDKEFYSGEYNKFYSGSEYDIYRNDHAIRLGAAVDADYLSLSPDDSVDSFEFLTDIVSSMLGRRAELFTECDFMRTGYSNCTITRVSGHEKYKVKDTALAADISYTVTCNADGDVYIYLPTDYSRETTVRVNGIDYGKYLNEGSYMLNIGSYKAGDVLDVVVSLEADDLYIKTSGSLFCTMNSSVVNEALSEISSASLEVTRFEDTHISGKVVSSDERCVLYTSIPYDEGWAVKVDGERVPIMRAAGALLAVELSPGEHFIELDYLPSCFVYGSVISICGVALFICECGVSCALTRRRRKRWAESNRIV